MEQEAELQRRVRAFQERLGQFLKELGNLAPLQRRLVEDAAQIAMLSTGFGGGQSSSQLARHDAA